MRTITCLPGIYAVTGDYLKLRNVYKRTLLMLTKVPKEAAYRRHTEGIISHKLNIVLEAGDDVKEIEENLNCGKLEILLLQARAELELCDRMLLWKPWEELIQKPPPGQWDWPPAQL